MNSKNLAIVILAAGKSSRMGDETKQLLKYKEETLLKIASKKALKISNAVYVVLGHDFELCQDEIKDLDVNIIYNKDFEKGIGSSISCAVSKLNDYENIMITLCDQPFISTEHLNSLKKHIDNKTIISTIYEDSKNATVPAVFPKKYFNELMKLNEDIGARNLLNKEVSIKTKLEKNQSVDIDTPKDVSIFLNIQLSK